jgi:hypothetical protein
MIMYVYTLTNILKKRQDYMYTPWHGKDFITEYISNRKHALSKLEDNYTTAVSEYELIKDIESTLQIQSSQKTQNINTTAMLLALINNNLELTDHASALFKIESLLKSFEVRKKIYTKYNELFKPLSKEFSNLENYILFCIVLLKQFTLTNEYRYLNTILKLNDLIISTGLESVTKTNKALISLLLTRELSCIQKLLQERSIQDE